MQAPAVEIWRSCLYIVPRCAKRSAGDGTNGCAEIDGHENAGHASGVWIGLHGTDFDLAVLPSNRLLLRFQECSRSKSKLKTIRLYSDDHCVFHRCPSQKKDAGIVRRWVDFKQSIQLTALLWLVFCRCFEKNCTLHCNVIYFQTIYICCHPISMSVIFSQPGTN